MKYDEFMNSRQEVMTECNSCGKYKLCSYIQDPYTYDLTYFAGGDVQEIEFEYMCEDCEYQSAMDI